MARLPDDGERFMACALDLARRAFTEGETPVGAVVVRDGAILGTGYNRVEQDHDPTAHAEILAIREAAKKVGNWRLPGSVVYVTLEPCIMCSAALVAARVGRVVFGAWDHRWGGLGSLFDLSRDPRINHQLEVISGIMRQEAAELLHAFFEALRTGP